MSDEAAGYGLGPAWDEHQVRLTRLREAEHWRRLVAARLDLAVAAVADIDALEDCLPTLGGEALRHLLGVPHDDGRLGESSRLVDLRAALVELDTYVARCREQAEAAARRLGEAVAATQPQLTVSWG